MKTNRELDVWIAVNVFGWNRISDKPHPTDNRQIDGALYSPPGCSHDCGQASYPPHYTLDYNCANAAPMEVLKAVAAECTVTIEFTSDRWMVSRLLNTGGDYVEDFCRCAETLPVAICLFAKAVFHGKKGLKP